MLIKEFERRLNLQTNAKDVWSKIKTHSFIPRGFKGVTYESLEENIQRLLTCILSFDERDKLKSHFDPLKSDYPSIRNFWTTIPEIAYVIYTELTDPKSLEVLKNLGVSRESIYDSYSGYWKVGKLSLEPNEDDEDVIEEDPVATSRIQEKITYEAFNRASKEMFDRIEGLQEIVRPLSTDDYTQIAELIGIDEDNISESVLEPLKSESEAILRLIGDRGRKFKDGIVHMNGVLKNSKVTRRPVPEETLKNFRKNLAITVIQIKKQLEQSPMVDNYQPEQANYYFDPLLELFEINV